MTRKKSWLARLEEIDRKDQSRLDKKNSSVGVHTVFQSNKRRRSGKQAEQEKTIKLTFIVYVFFIIEICTLAGVVLGDSGNSSLASGLAVIVWAAILSILGVAVGIVALAIRPRPLYIHIPFILNCLLLFPFLLSFIF